MKSKIIKIIFSILMIMLIIFGIWYVNENIFESEKTMNLFKTVSLIAGKPTNEYNQYHVETNDWVCYSIDGTYLVPLHPGYQIYCTESTTEFYYGTPINYYYKGWEKLNAKEAYVVSYPPVGEWSQLKQWAIWDIIAGGFDDHWDKIKDERLAFKKEYDDYANYYSQVKNNGVNPQKNSSSEVEVKESDSYYIIGPFNIKYNERNWFTDWNQLFWNVLYGSYRSR